MLYILPKMLLAATQLLAMNDELEKDVEGCSHVLSQTHAQTLGALGTVWHLELHNTANTTR